MEIPRRERNRGDGSGGDGGNEALDGVELVVRHFLRSLKISAQLAKCSSGSTQVLRHFVVKETRVDSVHDDAGGGHFGFCETIREKASLFDCVTSR